MYVDANVIIAAYFDAGTPGERARDLFRRIRMGAPALTSALTFDEIFWILRKNGWAHEMRHITKRLYSLEHFRIVSVSPLVPHKAMDIIEAHGLHPRDAFHIAVMQENKEVEIASLDSDFDRVPGVRRVEI